MDFSGANALIWLTYALTFGLVAVIVLVTWLQKRALSRQLASAGSGSADSTAGE